MGVLAKNHKRKFNKSRAPNPDNIKVKHAEMIVEDTNENDVPKAKAKKNKISVMPIESINDNDTTVVKAKKNKNKIVEMPAGDESVEVKPKKMKFVEVSNETSVSDLGKPKAKKSKKNKHPENPSDELIQNKEDNEIMAKNVKKNEAVETSGDADVKGITEEMMARYPILKDKALIKKFQAVKLGNNQRGRVRLQLRQQLRGTSDAMLPDAINIKIQAILKADKPNLTKLRMLFNMLRTALLGTKPPVKKDKSQSVKKEKKQKPKKDKGTEDENGTEEKKPEEKKPEQKVKGPKRYVVFIGNLPLDITKEKILEHFSDFSENIKDVRIPNPLENRKSRIAYLEVADELTYELALSKHHTMLDNKRINVLYSTQQNSKISKSEAKGKAAKLVAMQKSGQLAGSEPLSKKRSARRKKMKEAQKKAQEAAERVV